MSEYTPGDIEVRSAYIERQWNAAAILSDVSGPWFDRWLAAHDEQVRAAERERCAKIAESFSEIPGVLDADQFVQTDIAIAIDALRAVPAEQKESN